MTKKTDQQEELETTKSIEEAAKEVAHTTKFDTDKEVRQTPEEVKIREGTAARCTKVIKIMVLRKQARKARADHVVA